MGNFIGDGSGLTNLPTLRPLTEGTTTGLAIPYRIANPANYGVIGQDAIDISYSSNASTTKGATGDVSLALNAHTTASGDAATAMGSGTISSGIGSLSTGLDTRASGMGSVVIGMSCSVDSMTSLGLGYSTIDITATESNQNLGILLDGFNGRGYFDDAADLGNADYAEYFETASGNTIEPGYFVCWEEGSDKIQLGNDDVIGIVSAAPAVVGDSASLNWTGKYLRDEFDRYIWEDVEVTESVGKDENGDEIFEKKIMRDKARNPDYDPTTTYIPRSERPEWVPVGLLGKLWVRTDDSTLKVGDKVDAGVDGKAIKGSSWRVIGIREGLVRVLYR